jgi:hypothetical protein
MTSSIEKSGSCASTTCAVPVCRVPLSTALRKALRGFERKDDASLGRPTGRIAEEAAKVASMRKRAPNLSVFRVFVLAGLVVMGDIACRPQPTGQVPQEASRGDDASVGPEKLTAAPIPTPLPRPSTTLPATGPKPSHTLTARVDCRAPGKKISDHIYGIAWDLGDPAPQSFRMGATSRRWGGNASSRYNPDLGAWNSANDWYWENHGITTHQVFFKQNRENQMTSAYTVPLLGWVAKDKTSYAFPVAKHGAQKKVDPQKPDAGNGVAMDGKNLPSPPPETTSIPAPPELVAKWVSELRASRDAGQNDVGIYILDNEPALWNSTHRDVHPEALGYDELMDRTFRYGDAVRAADPKPKIAGPAEWGWPGYSFSAKDAVAGFQVKPDRLAHGDVPLSAHYLRKIREHEKKTGKKLLDLFDLHFYPQGDGVFSDKADATTQALRIRQTRGLWDPSYKDESWIRDTVMLFPRMRKWVDENAPGVGLMLGEWNFGGELDQSGALAAAETLGKLAEYGVEVAYYWRVPKDLSSVYWAFRAFRNFDDRGARFQDALAGVASDETSRIYVSRDTSGKRLVAVLLNFSTDAAFTADISLVGCEGLVPKDTRVFDYRNASRTGLTERTGGATKSSADVRTDVAPYTVTVLDLGLAAP